MSSEVAYEGIDLVETPFAQLLKLHKDGQIQQLPQEERDLLAAQALIQAVIEHSNLNWADAARLDRDRNYYLRNAQLLNAVCRSFTSVDQIMQVLSGDSPQQRIRQVGVELQRLLNSPGTETHRLFTALISN